MPKIGDYVCVRSHNQGCVLGTLQSHFGRECTLTGARQIYNWRSDALTLFDVVAKGPVKTQCRLSAANAEITMTEICGILSVPKGRTEEFQTYASES